MLIDEFHPEDIKAEIRKRYGTLLAFERANGLHRQAVTEVLRGRRSARTERAVRLILADAAKWAVGNPISPASSSAESDAHRLSDKAA